MNDLFERSADYFRQLQDRICASLAAEDGTPFREDPWQYQGPAAEAAKEPAAGGGRTRVLAEGSVFEKAGVNFSQVTGTFPPDLAETMPGSGTAFQATGISLVLHPRSPMVPTVHANFRYLARGNKAWFGGGADLTPYYPFRADCVHFHRVWRDVSARHAPTVDYQRMKTWCDEYFFLKHRGEARGVGGIFFDYMDHSPEAMFDFVRDAGDHFIESYVPIVQRRRDEPFSDREREFQLYRRGRYVEFNLVYDRGTVFGLKTGGRIESILMSLPPLARWIYDFRSTPGSREARLAEYLKARDWAAMDPAGDGADGLD